jgi:hypothetical protein
MKKLLIVLIAAFAAPMLADAQVYYTKTGTISFNSSSSVEKIEATNKGVGVKLNATTGDLDFVALNKSFVFAIQLMQEHFNENYMESDKFAKSTFKGKITNISAVNFAKDGTYNVNVEGNLSIHGVTKKVKVPGTVTIKGGKVNLNAKFVVTLADYGIKVPNEVKDKISKTSTIAVSCSLDKLK